MPSTCDQAKHVCRLNCSLERRRALRHPPDPPRIPARPCLSDSSPGSGWSFILGHKDQAFPQWWCLESRQWRHISRAAGGPAGARAFSATAGARLPQNEMSHSPIGAAATSASAAGVCGGKLVLRPPHTLCLSLPQCMGSMPAGPRVYAPTCPPYACVHLCSGAANLPDRQWDAQFGNVG